MRCVSFPSSKCPFPAGSVAARVDVSRKSARCGIHCAEDGRGGRIKKKHVITDILYDVVSVY